MEERAIQAKLSRKLQTRLDSFDGVRFLDLSGLENESVEASAVDYLSVHSDVGSLRVQDFKGVLDVGRAEFLVTCRKLWLANCQIKTMTASRAAFEQCEFNDCEFGAIRAVGASFAGCSFKGVIRLGIFDCSNRLPGAQGKLPFLDNDFRNCELRDTAFRGGIDLRRQIFSEEQRLLIIPNARSLLARLDEFIAKRGASEGFKRFRDSLRRGVVDFEQEQIFLSKDALERARAKSGASWETCVAACPEFARWASKLEQLSRPARRK